MLRVSIIDIYLFRECAKSWVSVAGVLIVLTLGVGFARFIASAAAGELPGSTVMTIVGFSLLQNLEIILPISLLLAVMLTVGRLCSDNEMAAMTAGGVGPRTLYRPFLLLAGLLTLGAALLSVQLGPGVERQMSLLKERGDVLATLESFDPGRFHTLMSGRAAFYAERSEATTGEMADVFIRVKSQNAQETVVLADRAVRQSDPDSGRQTLVLWSGWRYEGIPGQPDFRITRFSEHGVHMAPPQNEVSFGLEEAETAELLAADSPEAAAELHLRLSVPLSVFILALLALPLGYLPPRSSRYGKLVIGILVYVVYANLLRLGAVYLSDGVIPAWLGLWWVHLVFAGLALVLIARREGRLRFRRPAAVGAASA